MQKQADNDPPPPGLPRRDEPCQHGSYHTSRGHSAPSPHSRPAGQQLSGPRQINQKFKAAAYHSDSRFTYDENQRGAEIPSILRGAPRPAQVTPPGSGPRTFSSNIHFLNRTRSPDHKANRNFLARRAPADRAACHRPRRGRALVPISGLWRQVLLIRYIGKKQEPAKLSPRLWKSSGLGFGAGEGP